MTMKIPVKVMQVYYLNKMGFVDSVYICMTLTNTPPKQKPSMNLLATKLNHSRWKL